MNPQALTNRLLKNQRHLGKWARREGIDAYRLYDRDIPEFPFSIDRYADWLHIQHYEKKREISDQQLHDIVAAISETMDIPRSQLSLKTRKRQRGTEQYEKAVLQSPSFQVMERGLSFEVNLLNYLDTGLFLDHRDTRQMIREQAAGKRFLNLFAYTGSFTVYAAAGGASRTTTVDMSKTYQAWSQRNLEHNHLADDSRHRFLQSDVLGLMHDMRVEKRRFDLIMLDPPSFSNSKRMNDSFDIQRDQLDLLTRTLAVLAPDGQLFFSNNRQGFKLDPRITDQAEVTEITGQTIPADFKRHRPHRCWKLTR